MTRRNACAEAGVLGLKMYDIQNSHWNVSLQAVVLFSKWVILKYILKKDNSMNFVGWTVRIHGGISKMGTVIVVED